MSARATASVYDLRHAWPPEIAEAVALHLRRENPAARRALFLGAATGVNDALPFARVAPEVRVVASDVDPDFLRALAERAPSNVDVRRIDLRDLADVEPVDLVAAFFVAHRLPDWRDVVPGLAATAAGTLYVSEWAGGLIHLANEGGGSGGDPVSRLLRRFHELREGPREELRTSRMKPFLDALPLAPAGHRDFHGRRRVSVGEVLEAMEEGAYAPFRRFRPDVERLREEFFAERDVEVEFLETLRVHGFRGSR